jgi:prophage regulatory protein
MSDGSVVGLQEVAAMLGVTHQRADQIAKAYDDFPEPLAVLAVGRIWSRDAVEQWVSAHPVRPAGRPRRPPRDDDGSRR